MKTITLKNIPEPLYRALKRRAAANRRSLNSELLASLESLLPARKLSTSELLARMDAVRESVRLPYLTDEDLRRAKAEGRP